MFEHFDFWNISDFLFIRAFFKLTLNKCSIYLARANMIKSVIMAFKEDWPFKKSDHTLFEIH